MKFNKTDKDAKSDKLITFQTIPCYRALTYLHRCKKSAQKKTIDE